jgi:hypothetical protein
MGPTSLVRARGPFDSGRIQFDPYSVSRISFFHDRISTINFNLGNDWNLNIWGNSICRFYLQYLVGVTSVGRRTLLLHHFNWRLNMNSYICVLASQVFPRLATGRARCG